MFRPRSIGLLLTFITLIVYLPATFNQFIDFDDPDYVADNPVVQKGLTWAGVKWAFAGAHASNWHPVTWLSHMVDSDLFRSNPAGLHLINILFHAMNTMLLFWLLMRMTNSLWSCAFIASLFAWHPLHVESVAWIAERKDVLSTFFTLLTLSSYSRYAQNNRLKNFWCALFFFTLALLSKPMPVTLPFVMLLLDYWPLKRFENYKRSHTHSADLEISKVVYYRLLIFEKLPFLLLSIIVCVITFLSQRNTAVSSLANLPLQFRLENMLTAYAGYLWKMIWPVNLAIFYPLHAPIAWQLLAESIILLAGFSIIIWLERKRSPWLIVGWLWFLITLVPVIGLVQVGSQAMADRYSYFPLIGIFLAVVFSAKAIAARFNFLNKFFTAAAILVLVSCLFLTEKQLQYWHDSESLFTHTLAVENSASAHISLGGALRDENRPIEAMTQYILAWRINPDSDLAYGNIARLLDDAGKPELAAVYYEKAVKQKSRSVPLYKNYGLVLIKLGRFAEAMNEFSTAASIEPADAQIPMLKGRLFLQQGINLIKQNHLDEAANKFYEAKQVDPTSAQPYFFLGRLRLQQQRDAEALEQLQSALKLDPNNLQIIIFTVSVLAADQNAHIRDGVAALELARKAVQLTNGQQPAVLDVMAMASAETGHFDDAINTEKQAIELAENANQKEDVALMQQRLQLYEKHLPWRESFKEN